VNGSYVNLEYPVWGVDIAASNIAVGCWLPTDEHKTATVHLNPKNRGADRIRAAHYALVPHLHALREEWGEPGLVLIEKPHMGHDFFMFTGCVITSVCEATPAVVHVLGASDWKKRAGFDARLRRVESKAEIMAWARGVGYAGDSQDEADALGLAHAARRMAA
jgi:hypothetical protein